MSISRAVERAMNDIADSKFEFLPYENVAVTDAVIIWPNFEGRENRFKNKTKNFNLVLNEEAAKILGEKGMKIHEAIDKDTGNVLIKYINVKVYFDSRTPALVYLHTKVGDKRSTSMLDADSVKMLDSIRMESCDVLLHVSEVRDFPGNFCAYLTKIHVEPESSEPDFGGKWDEWTNDAIADKIVEASEEEVTF